MWAWTYESKLARDVFDFVNILGWLVALLLLCVTYAVNMIGFMVAGGGVRFIGVVLPPIGSLLGFLDVFNSIYRV